MAKKRAAARKTGNRRRAVALLAGLCVIAAGLLAVGGFLLLRGTEPDSSSGWPADNPSSMISPPETSSESSVPEDPYRPILPESLFADKAGSPVVLLYDMEKEAVLFRRDADKKMYPASLTKLLTAAVALEHAAPDTYFTVGPEIRLIDPEASRAYLVEGWTMTLEGLLAGLLMPSGSDAAYCIAVNIGRRALLEEASDPDTTVDDAQAMKKFTALMNETAQRLGCTSSHFVTVDGLHDPDHYTTAIDLLKIVRHALSFETIETIVSRPRMSVYLKNGKGVMFQNTNMLLRPESDFYFAQADGLKTGFTDQAGYCLAASATRDGRRLIALLMGAPELEMRFSDAAALFRVAFDY